jgi:NAD(P)-dependent dehydrogenase (short-subunit alcohol dehydrogenase family)
MQELKDKTVLVTGAGRSLGRMIALHLARLGASVAVNYNTSAKGAEEVCAEISRFGCKTLSVQADVSNPTAVREMFQTIHSKLGEVDVLVNSAAVNIDATIRKMDDEAWNEVLAVNLAGTFHCAREAIPAMRERQWGRIINISSVTGFTGAFGAANYAAAKAAIIGFTKSLALEVARYGITANAVAPGYFNIGMGERLPEKFRSELLKMIPLGRFGRPEEMTAAVAFLASRNASYITGQVIHVNGGFYM